MPPVPKAKSGKAWDNRADTDAARATAEQQVANQEKDEGTKVAAIKKSHADEAASVSESKTTNSGKREGALQNNWHESWVTKIKPQPTPEHDQHDWKSTLAQAKK